MTVRVGASVAATIALAGVAHADPPDDDFVASVELGGGLSLSLEGKYVVAHLGKQSAPLYRADGMHHPVIDGAVHAVMIDFDNMGAVCRIHFRDTLRFDRLRATVLNRAAYLLHVKKDWTHAAEGFARAAAADPDWEIPAYNLASARVELKDYDGAIAALAPRLATAPLAVFIQVASDPELAPLRARPEIKAIAAKQPGDAKATFNGAVYAAERGLVAVRANRWDIESCTEDDTLDLYDSASGKRVASVMVRGAADFDGCEYNGPGPTAKLKLSKAAIAARDAANTAVLDQLGFSATALEEASSGSLDDAEKSKTAFAKAKLGVVVSHGNVNVLRGNTSLGTGTGEVEIGTSYLLIAPRIAVIDTYTPEHGNCGTGAHTPVVIKLK